MPRPVSNTFKQGLELRPLSKSADALKRLTDALKASHAVLKYTPKIAPKVDEYKATVANLSAMIMASVQSGQSQLQMTSRLAMLNADSRLGEQASYIAALHERTVRQLAGRLEKHHGIKLTASGPSPIEEKFKPGPGRVETLPLDKVTAALDKVHSSRPEVVAALWGQFGSTVSGWWSDCLERQTRECRAIAMQLSMPSVRRQVPVPPSSFYSKLYDSKRRISAEALMKEPAVDLPYRVLTVLTDSVDLTAPLSKVELAVSAFAVPDVIRPFKEAGVKIDTSTLDAALYGSYAIWLQNAQAGHISASINVEVPVVFKSSASSEPVTSRASKHGYNLFLTSKRHSASSGLVVGSISIPDHVRKPVLESIVAAVKSSGVMKQHDHGPVADLAGMLTVALAQAKPVMAAATVGSDVEVRVEPRYGNSPHVAVFMRVSARTTVNQINADSDVSRSAKTRLSLSTLIGTPETNLKMANTVLSRPGSSLVATTSFPEHSSKEGDVVYAVCMGFAVENCEEVMASESLFLRVVEDLTTIARLVGTEEASADCPENRAMIEDYVSSRGSTSVARLQAGGKRLVVVNPREYRAYEVTGTKRVKGVTHYQINVDGQATMVSGGDWTERRV